jgi:hypothetical protein
MPEKPEEFNLEEFQEYGREVLRHFDECDRLENDEKERSLTVLMEFLGVRTGDYKSGFLRYLERYGPPAFKKAETRGAKPGKKFVRLLKLLAAIEEIQRNNPDMSDVEALRQHDPKLKGIKAKNKLAKQQQYLSQARALVSHWRAGGSGTSVARRP